VLMHFRSSTKHEGRYRLDNYLDGALYPVFTKFSLHRKPIVTLDRVRAGHKCLKAFLGSLDVAVHATWDWDYEETAESPNHILWPCRRFEASREDTPRDLTKCKAYPPYKMKPFLWCLASIYRYLIRNEIIH
jgi:hypothetical protein